jgi:hypothetical protein
MKIRELNDGRFKYMARVCADCGHDPDVRRHFDENEAYRCGMQNCIICGISTVNLSTGIIPRGANTGREIQRTENFLDEIQDDVEKGISRARGMRKGRYSCVIGDGDDASRIALATAIKVQEEITSETTIKFGFVNDDVELGQLLTDGNDNEIWIIHMSGTERMYTKFAKLQRRFKNVRNIIFVANEEICKVIKYPFLKIKSNGSYNVDRTERMESLWRELEDARCQ